MYLQKKVYKYVFIRHLESITQSLKSAYFRLDKCECECLEYLFIYLQTRSKAKPHWAHVGGYGPFFLCVIHKEGLCPSSKDINGLMMISL
jgi:hypothetical protein